MESTKSQSSPVLIIGGGLAGLALAQILKSHCIAFAIFERDIEPTARNQGWAVALTHCLPQLASLLPSRLGDLHSTSVNSAISVPDVVAVLDATTGSNTIAKLGGAPVGQPGHLIRARRNSLRTFLSKDLDIHYGKQFSHYVEDDRGVTAHFMDRTSARGSLLIGVDGAHSPIRSQLLSQTARPASFVPIMGTITLSRSQYEKIHETGSAGIISGDDNLRWLLSLISIKPDRSSANYFYAVCYRTDQPQIEADWVSQASKHQLFDKAVSLTKATPQFLRDIIQLSGVDHIVHPALRFVEFEPPLSLPSGRVTLAGDAAHAMMPFKGAGANSAFLDICDLAKLLSEAQAGHHDLDDAEIATQLLRRYESIALPRGKRMVAGSGATGKDIGEILGAGKIMGPTERRSKGRA